MKSKYKYILFCPLRFIDNINIEIEKLISKTDFNYMLKQ